MNLILKKYIPVTVVILTLNLLISCDNAEQRKTTYVSKAKAYIAEENFEKARIELKNALQIAPNDIENRYLLAEISEKLEDWPQAVGHYKAVIEQDKSHVKARNQMARLLYFSKNYKESRILVDDVLLIDPNNVDGLTLRASHFSRENEDDNAMSDALAALKIEPSNVDAAGVLASLYSKIGLTEKFEKLLLVTIKKNPENIPLRVMLGEFYVKEDKEKKAVSILKNIIEIKPDLIIYRIQLASLFVRYKRLVDAENVLRESIAHNPENTESKLLLVDFFFQQGDKDKAEKELIAFIKTNPEAYSLRIALANLYIAEDKIDKAKQVYQYIIESAGLIDDGLQARVKLALLIMKENDLQKAESLLNEVLKENINHNEALVLRGQLSLIKKDAVNAVIDFRSALKDQPDSIEILQYIARAHTLNKEFEQTIDYILTALVIDKNNFSLRYELAQVYSLNGNNKKSIEQYQTILAIKPKNIKVRLALFDLLMKTSDYSTARKLAEDTKTSGNDSLLGYYFLGLVYQNEKQFSESIKELKIALDKQPNATNILAALIDSYLLNKQAKAAISQLQKFSKGSPGDVVAINMLAEIYISEKQYKQAIAQLNKAKELKPGWITTYHNMARAYLAKSDKQGAFAALEEGIKNTGGAEQLIIETSAIYEQFKEVDNAIANYESALKKNPNSVVLANNLAMMLVTYKKDQQSLVRAKELMAVFIDSTSADLKDSVGWVLYKLGEVNQSIPYLEQAAVVMGNVPIVNYHLGMAYFKKGDKKQSQQFLQKALASNVNFRGVEEASVTLEKLTAPMSE